MTVNELNEELVGVAGSHKVQLVFAVEVKREDGSTKHFHVRLDANDFQNSTCFDRCYISCDTVHIELGKE